MVGHGMRALWDEPRPAHPPARVWRDWALVGVVVCGSVVEAVLREDRAWLPVAVAVSAVIALTLLWRRTHPLAAVVISFGTLIAFDIARIVAIDVTGLVSIAAALVLPYALYRWGSGREAVIGLGIILVWLGITHVADPTPVAEVVAGYGFFLFSAALGASIRFHATTRIRDIEQAKLRQRHELARDLHDAIGHHVSGIAIQAQAGQAVAASDPDRALAVLAPIEDAATRALEEMRAIVGVLRDGGEPDLAPQPDIGDIEQLARAASSPRVDVHLTGALGDLPQPVGVTLYRIAQEAVTNALRHARNATRVSVEVSGDAERVRLTVRDDGDTGTVGRPASGFGVVGMRERTALLGGTLFAGPGPDGEWVVEAALPKRGPTTSLPDGAAGSG
jgi:signal transduction histidine kinase